MFSNKAITVRPIPGAKESEPVGYHITNPKPGGNHLVLQSDKKQTELTPQQMGLPENWKPNEKPPGVVHVVLNTTRLKAPPIEKVTLTQSSKSGKLVTTDITQLALRSSGLRKK